MFKSHKKNVCRMLVTVLILMMSISFQSVSYATTALPRISVQSDTQNGAYFKVSGNSIEMKGSNYTHVIEMTQDMGPIDGSATLGYHSNLLVNQYDPIDTELALKKMKNNGYNYVRIIISGFGKGTRDGIDYYGIAGPYTTGSNHYYGLYKPYLDNVVDFIRKANAIGIYVVPTLDWLPHNEYYQTYSSDYPKDANQVRTVDSVNASFLASRWIDLKCTYVQRFMQYIKYADANLLSTIAAVDFQNEVYCLTDKAPFSRTDTVTLANGNSYNMSNDTQRQAAMDDSINYWANRLVTSLQSVDSSALATSSVYTFKAIGLSGPNGVHQSGSEKRYPARPLTLSSSSNLSFIDVHIYQGWYSVDTELSSIEFSNISKSYKPFWMGEFGAYKSQYADVDSAATGSVDHRDDLVSRGFRGWGYWTWDDHIFGLEPHIWSALEGDGEKISSALAPVPNAGELLANAGFENGTTSWTGSISVETAHVFSGIKSMKSYNRGYAWDGPIQDVKSILLSAGQGNYTASTNVKLSSGTDNATATLKITDNTGTHYFYSYTAANSNNWTRCTWNQNITWSGTLSAAVLYVQTSSSTADFYIDECSFKKENSISLPYAELLANSGFENGSCYWTGSSLSSDTTNVVSGSKSIKSYGRSNTWDGPSTDITSALLANGQGNYYASVYGKLASGASGSDSIEITIQINDNNGSHWYYQPIPANSSTWTRNSWVKNVTWTGTLSSARIYVQTTTTTGDFYVDDCTLRKVP